MQIKVTAITKPNLQASEGVLQHLLEQVAIRISSGEKKNTYKHPRGFGEASFELTADSLPADPPEEKK